MSAKKPAQPVARPDTAARPMLLPIAIFAVAFALRLGHVLQLRSTPFSWVLMGDSRGYDEWAQRIAGGEWWGHEVFYQAPLYPYFLGVLYSVAGRHLLLVRLVQAAIGSASCVLVALAAGRLISPRAGVAAGLMLALYAPAIFFDGLLQKSVLDVFFVSLALWLIARIVADADSGNAKAATLAEPDQPVRPPRPLRSPSLCWFELGLAMGALSLTRENALVFIVVIIGWALFKGRHPLRPWRPLRSLGAFVVGLAVVLVPVAVRNSLVGGGFYVTTSQFGPNFYIGNNPRADGTYASLRYGRGAPEFERQDATELAELALGRRLSPGEVSSYWTDRALQFITSRPGAWLALMARKAALVVNRDEMVDTEDQASYAEWSWPLKILGPVANFGILVPLAVFGLFITWPRRSRLFVLYALLLAYAASVVLFYVFARYRYPLVPMLIVFAAAAVANIRTLVRPEPVEGRDRGSTSSPRARAWMFTAVFCAFVASNWPFLSTNHMRAVTENNLAAALQADNRLDEAEAHYRRSVAFRPDYAPAYSNLGTVLRARGRRADSIAAYEEALRLEPDYPDAHYNLANALTDEGRAADAIRHFRIALRMAPGSAEVHNNLGIALASSGRRDEARAEFESALRMDPASARAHRNLGDALLSAGRGPEALEHFRRATELAPEDGSFHYDYGSVLLEAGRPQEAAAAFRAALKRLPRSPDAHNNLGIALGMLGRLDEAIGEFQEALRANPDFVDARKNLKMAAEARARAR